MWRNATIMAHPDVSGMCRNNRAYYFGAELRRKVMGPIGCVLGLVMQIIQSALMIISLPFILIGYIFMTIFGDKK